MKLRGKTPPRGCVGAASAEEEQAQHLFHLRCQLGVCLLLLAQGCLHRGLRVCVDLRGVAGALGGVGG